MKQHELHALPTDTGRRIDLFVSEQLSQLTRNAVQRLCGEGAVLVDGKPAAKNYKMRGGEGVTVKIPDTKPALPAPQDIPLDIVYEDAHILVVNKPRGLVVHPAPGNPDGTLVNALLHHCGGEFSGIGGVGRPGIVHRIDKMTSGLLVVAKTAQAHENLSAQIKAHQVTRLYEAVVHGGPREDEGTINAPVGRHPGDRKKMCVARAGDNAARNAVTHYRVLARYRGFSHLELRLETGRTHQIRVHLAHVGHPVAGDPVYGPKKGVSSLGGQCLHARTLELTHPISGEELIFTTALPGYFADFLGKLQE